MPCSRPSSASGAERPGLFAGRNTLLAGETPSQVTIKDFEVAPLDESAALVMYTSVHEGSRARRSSVWVQREGTWFLLFHQGTPILE